MPLELKVHHQSAQNRLPHEGQPAPERAQNARALGADGHLRAHPPGPQRRARASSCTTALPTPAAPSTWAPRMNKCLKDFIVKSKTMAGFDAPYVPGWDCHGLPIEIKVDKELGGKKLQMQPTRRPRRVPQVRPEISRSAAHAVQAYRRLRTLRSTLRHHESAVRVGRALNLLLLLRKRIRLQGPARRLLVHARRDRARRSRSRIRKPHQPHGLGEVRAARRSREDRSCARRQESFHHHLDHDSLDAACVHGRRLSSRRRIRRARIRRRSLHRRGETGGRRRREVQACRSERRSPISPAASWSA